MSQGNVFKCVSNKCGFFAISTGRSTSNCTSRLGRWLSNTTVPHVEYYASRSMMSYPECISFCNQLGSCANIAEYFVFLVTSEFTDALCMSLFDVWIQKIGQETGCYILSNRRVTQTLPCKPKARCLCQRRTTTSTITYSKIFEQQPTRLF